MAGTAVQRPVPERSLSWLRGGARRQAPKATRERPDVTQMRCLDPLASGCRPAKERAAEPRPN